MNLLAKSSTSLSLGVVCHFWWSLVAKNSEQIIFYLKKISAPTVFRIWLQHRKNKPLYFYIMALTGLYRRSDLCKGLAVFFLKWYKLLVCLYFYLFVAMSQTGNWIMGTISQPSDLDLNMQTCAKDRYWLMRKCEELHFICRRAPLFIRVGQCEGFGVSYVAWSWEARKRWVYMRAILCRWEQIPVGGQNFPTSPVGMAGDASRVQGGVSRCVIIPVP